MAFVAAALASGAMIAVLALLSEPSLRRGDFAKNLERWMEESTGSLSAAAALLVPAQLCFLGVAIFFAILERERVLPRLGFVRWKAPGSTVALAVVGTLGVQFLLDLAAEAWIDEPSEQLKMLMKMFTEPKGLAAIAVGFLMSVLPGVCEESLYRGLSQRGLLRRWSPLASIGVTSLFFAAAHGDVQHSLGVFPLGIWLGYVAWRTGSVWPAVMCHFVNNLAAFVFMRTWLVGDSYELPEGPAMYIVGAALVAVMIVAIFRLRRTEIAGSRDQSFVPPMNR